MLPSTASLESPMKLKDGIPNTVRSLRGPLSSWIITEPPAPRIGNPAFEITNNPLQITVRENRDRVELSTPLGSIIYPPLQVLYFVRFRKYLVWDCFSLRSSRIRGRFHSSDLDLLRDLKNFVQKVNFFLAHPRKIYFFSVFSSMVKRYRASLPNQRISPERRTLIIARYKELKSLRAVANELKISRNVFFSRNSMFYQEYMSIN